MTTKIEWVQNPDGTKGETWNPVRGCTRVSKGCEHCYAETLAHRWSGPGQAYEGLTVLKEGGPRWTGKIKLVPEALEKPLRWRKPRRVFVNSMSDIFHEGVPDEFIDRVFAVMALSPQHTFQILTKRPERMLAYLTDWPRDESKATLPEIIERTMDQPEWVKLPYGRSFPRYPGYWPLPNVWLGVSVEDQATADERIPLLLQTPAAIRFVSYEPALGEVDFSGPGFLRENGCHTFEDGKEFPAICTECGGKGSPALDWVIVGGESGPGARPMSLDWARDVRDQCEEAGVPFFFKQGSQANWKNFKDFDSFPRDLQIREFPESSDGR